MNGLPDLPLNIRGCIADTCHMTNEEAGAHFRLVILACQSPRLGVPDDDSRLAAMLGITLKRWAKLKPVVMGLWYSAGGIWTHRCLEWPQPRKRRKPLAPKRGTEPRSTPVPANTNHPETVPAALSTLPPVTPAGER